MHPALTKPSKVEGLGPCWPQQPKIGSITWNTAYWNSERFSFWTIKKTIREELSWPHSSQGILFYSPFTLRCPSVREKKKKILAFQSQTPAGANRTVVKHAVDMNISLLFAQKNDGVRKGSFDSERKIYELFAVVFSVTENTQRFSVLNVFCGSREKDLTQKEELIFFLWKLLVKRPREKTAEWRERTE